MIATMTQTKVKITSNMKEREWKTRYHFSKINKITKY